MKLEISLEIDRLCDEYEVQILSDSASNIEEFLSKADDPIRDELFKQLLAIELEMKASHPVLDEYTARFPEYASEVESVFENLQLLEWNSSTIGKYQIVEELGRGGMGVVFKARDPNLDREVAIKLLTRERRSDFRWLRRFRQEARIASGLNHPNVLTIYEIGEDKQTPFIASELVEGITLRKKLAQNQLSLLAAIDIATQIASGMAAAHQAGIIHRDLKADNIMVRKDGLIKILDFGLAKQIQLPLANSGIKSRTGAITGTVHFMSPEQARGQRLTSATDVFSFGVVMYLMLSGKLPFHGPSMSEAIAQILNEEPASIPHDNDAIPTELTTLLFRCLDKDPEQRPPFEEIKTLLTSVQAEAAETDFALLAGKETGFDVAYDSTAQSYGTRLNDSLDHLEPGRIRYAQSGEVNIAWQEIGSGPIDIVFVMGWVSHLEWFWKDPSFSNFLKRLATFARVILFDKRGTGLSDKVPVNELPDLETRMDDVRAVMDAAGSEHAVLCGVSEGGPLCALFAATYPDKTIALTMIGSYSRRLWADDYPWGPTAEEREKFLELIGQTWGGPVGIETRAPSMSDDPAFREWWSTYLRMGASPGAAIALTKMNAQIDVRPILPSIHVPTLVIHRTGDQCLLVEEGKHLAEKIPGARFSEFPGDDHLPFVGDADSILEEIEWFLTGMSGGAGADCVLATVLCVRVSSTETELLEKFRSLMQREITLYRGQNFFTEESAFLVTFDGPFRSILCALATCRLASRLGVEVCCGLNTGTCNVDKSVIYGPAVEGAQNVATKCPNGKVWLTSTLKNLISGSEVMFEKVAEETDLYEALPNNR